MNLTTRIALAGLTLAGGLGPDAAEAQHPDLSGRWSYNATQSDNPRSMAQGRDSTGGGDEGGGGGGGRGGRGGRGGFGGRRGGSGGGGGRGDYGRGMSEEQRARTRQTMSLAFQAPTVLSISESDSTVSVTPDSGAVLDLHADGRKVKQTVEGGGDIEIKAHWQGNDFVVERKVSGGGKVTEDYLKSQDGKQLFVIVSLDSGRGRSIEFRRVYDAMTS
jgi:hypothetical protein